MRLDQLKAHVLSFPHATFVKQWGENLVFKIGGRMFLIVSLDGEIIDGCAFKCTPADYARLTAEVDGVTPASHNLFKSHWVQVEDIPALPESEFKHLLRVSYDLVKGRLTKKAQAALDGPPYYRDICR
jgi:predicted DNA-binding protein (MmcQ/YjbR family)